MPFESIQVEWTRTGGTEPAGIHLLKWFRHQPVETVLCVHRGFHETGISQHAQVLGHGRLRHAKLSSISPTDCSDETSRLKIARRLGSAMIPNTDSMSSIYATGHIRVKVYLAKARRRLQSAWWDARSDAFWRMRLRALRALQRSPRRVQDQPEAAAQARLLF